MIFVWWIFILIECGCICVLGYRYYDRRFVHTPKKIHVLPVEKDYTQILQDSGLQFYDEPKANIQIHENFAKFGVDEMITQTFNADGLHERFDYSTQKSPDVFRIISLGDSFTQGVYLNTEQNYSEVLEDMLNAHVQCANKMRFEVINLGVSGYDMQYNLIRYQRKGMKYTPDLVLLWTNDNDFLVPSESLRVFNSQWEPQVQEPVLVEKYRSLGDFYPEQTVLFNKFYETHPREALIVQEMEYLQELLKRIARPTIIFTLASFPEDIRLKIESVVSKYPSVHFYPEIPDNFPQLPDQHPSATGHTIFAEFLFNKITTSAYFSCKGI